MQKVNTSDNICAYQNDLGSRQHAANSIVRHHGAELDLHQGRMAGKQLGLEGRVSASLAPKEVTMKQAMPRLSLTALALLASAALAQAQTANDRDAHHPGGQTTAQARSPLRTPRQAGMPMAGPMAAGGMPGSMGGGMGSMMEMMRPMMAGRGGMEMPFEHVEVRIAHLKTELKITDAQAAPWNAFADAMRADATAMKAMQEGMARDGMPGSLPERLAARQKLMSAHVGMLERMEAETKPLYAALSAKQRTLLDQMTANQMGMM